MKLIAIICIVGLLCIGVLFAWITKEPVGPPEMDLSIAGCASTHHKVNGTWPQNYAQLEKSCDAFERRIIGEIKTLHGLTIDTEPIADGIRISLSGHYRGEFTDVLEMHFTNDSMTVDRK